MIVGAYEGESAKNVLARQRRALTIKIGQQFRINRKIIGLRLYILI